MSSRPLLITLPSEIAGDLVDSGFATATGSRRSSTWQVVASIATGAGTTIGLLQGPETLSYLAGKLKELFRRESSAPAATDETYYLEATGPRGQMRIPVSAGTSIDDIASLLRATIFATDES